ncbi:MAG: Gfo/Idh/MocA family oxidoreductase [Candidatus Lokiarchaeota archaeon]|nr:Gfo/Idh/MocA family oxidoreductase [Candidatus Lokiarchaeota archaeon]
MKIGIVGVGYWGANIARVFFELKNEGYFDGEVVIYDLIQERAKKVAGEYSFQLVNKLDFLLSDPHVNVVLIVTPSSTHFSLAKQVLESGKHVFVEKPFTLSSKDAAELIRLASENKVRLMVGHLFRYHQALRELKRRIKIGDLGKLLFMVANKYGIGVPKEDSGVIFTLAVNDFDNFCYILDVEYPETILAHRGIFLQEDYEEYTSISVTFPHNVQGYLSESWLIPIFGRRRELIVVGSKKTAVIEFLKPNEIVIHNAHIKKLEKDDRMVFRVEKKEPQKIFFEYKEPLKEEMKALLKMVKNNEESESSGVIGLRAINMCEIAMESAILGKKINVKEWLDEKNL